MNTRVKNAIKRVIRNTGMKLTGFTQGGPWLFAAVIVMALAAGTVGAANRTWDIQTGDSGAIKDGSGNWVTGSGNWNTGSGDTTWTDDSDATIGGGTAGAAGTITITSGVSANSLTFKSPNGGGAYTISGDTLTLTGSAAVTNTANSTIRSIIAGSVGLTKFGSGTLTLSGNNTYSGQTTINTGKLQVVVGGSCSNSTMILANAVATNSVSVTDNTKSWVCSSLTINAAGVMEFDFGTVTPSTTVSPLNITGLAAFTATPTVRVLATSPFFGAGTYPLMTWGSTNGPAPSTVTVSPMPRHTTASLSVSGNTLNLVISPAGGFTTYYVTTNGVGAGSSWGDATSLTNALMTAPAGSDIYMAQGTYTNRAGMSVVSSVTNCFVIRTNSLALYGGFTNGMATFAQRNPVAYTTKLQGMGSGQAGQRVLYFQASGAILDGLTVTGGYPGFGTSLGGGGLYSSGYDFTLANCVFTDIQARGAGGAYIGNANNVVVTNCTFTFLRQSRDTSLGQGLYISSVTNMFVIDSLFTNVLSGGAAHSSLGGGLYQVGGSITVLNTVFADINNTQVAGAACSGQGMYLGANTAASIKNCTFRKNAAANAASQGAGLYIGVGASTVSVESCTFAYNSNAGYGGAIYLASGNLQVHNSILWTNTASLNGNEIYQSGGTATVAYVCLEDTVGNYVMSVGGTLAISSAVKSDPLFATATDLRLKSSAGRWNPVVGAWTNDTVQSPSIDAGDPASSCANEPAPNGGIINLGFDGNTPYASKSIPLVAPSVQNMTPSSQYDVAWLTGKLTTGTVSAVTIYYGPNNGGTTPGSWSNSVVVSGVSSGQTFTAKVGGLLPNTTYWVTCYATNGAGGSWDLNPLSFNVGAGSAGGGANIIHVKGGAEGMQTGKDWYNAYPTLTKALAGLTAGITNEIWIASMTYNGAGYSANSTVALYGGFAGTETLRSQRNTANPAVLDGQVVNPVITLNAANCRIDGLTIKNGYSPTPGGTGAGVQCNGYSLTLANSSVISNSGWTAAIYVQNAAQVTFTNCLITGNIINSNPNNGIGLYAVNITNLLIQSCSFSDNGNNAGQREKCPGGGMYVTGGNLAVLNTTFIGNKASGTDTAVETYGGGAVYLANNNAQFMNCTFRTNAAAGSIVNTTSFPNSYGGAIYADVLSTKTVAVVNCTFAYNSATNSGGAIYLRSGNLSIKNAILWTNSVLLGSGREIYVTNGVVTCSYSDFTGTNSPYVVATNVTWGVGIITQDPLFVSATDLHEKATGGTWNPVSGSFTNYSVASPCIDSGDPSSRYALEPYFSNNRRINMGAYGNTPFASYMKSYPGTLIRVW